MVRNEEKVLQAIAFRKRGFTLAEIAKICDVSKSTVSNWLKGKQFSAEVTSQNQSRARRENGKRLKLVNKARAGEREKRYQEAVRGAKTEYQHYKGDPLFVAGLMAYLTCGDRSDSGVLRLSTTEQQAHGVFVRFLKAYGGIETAKIRGWLLLYQGQSETACMRSWQRATGIPRGQFHKTQYRPGKTQKQTLHSGVGNTIIGNTVLKQKVLTWLDLLQKDLKK